MEFHPSQKEAIRHGEGPALVVAGPGSGKTAVLAGRIRYLTEERQIPEHQILVLTFTKGAALEMEQRFLRQRGGGVKVDFGTFHSAFFRILKQSEGAGRLRIFSQEEKYRLLSRLLQDQGQQLYLEKTYLKDLSGQISRYKEEGEGALFNLCDKDMFCRLYKAYEAYKEEEGLADFDDILLRAKTLLETREDIRLFWKKRYRYILVDEFQDASRLQYELVMLLAAPENNVFFVGDDDQSIYGFRGVEGNRMAQIASSLPGCKIYRLNINYRSCQPVIDCASRLISFNRNRIFKNISGVRDGAEAVEFLECENEKEQAEKIRLFFRGRKGAVLFRTNRLIVPVAKELLKENIPFFVKEPGALLKDHWVAEDLLSYMRLGSGLGSRKDFLQILNKPFRGISREGLFGAFSSTEEKRRMEELKAQLSLLSALPPFAQIQFIRKGIGYEDYLKQQGGREGETEEELLFLADELQKKTIPFFTAGEWFSFLEKEKNALSRAGENKEKAALSLLTIHSAKGLEFESVFLPDWNEGILPYGDTASIEGVEEERRLAYVAITRAKDRLAISWVKKRRGREAKPSAFLANIREK